jgi:DNA-binding MarR family transcriptional regulator
MDAVRIIAEIAMPRRKVKPNFTPYHVVKALMIISRGRVGRPKLREELKLGDASTRTLLKRLREARLIRSFRPTGTELTEKGREVLKEVLSNLVMLGEIAHGNICSNCITSAVVLRNAANLLKRMGVVRVRDIVVKQGADGALVLLVGPSGRVLMPVQDGEVPLTDPLVLNIREKVSLREGDVILIAMCSPRDESCTEHVVNAAIVVLERG